MPLYDDATMKETRMNGWFRFWRNGHGIAWKPKDAPMLFSERNGYSKSLVIGRLRVKWLKRVTPQKDRASV